MVISDAISPAQRLSRLSPNVWQWKLALCFIAAAIVIALMCENVNAAPQGGVANARGTQMTASPAGVAPIFSHPLCATGFMLSQRIDTRDRFDWIVKRQWKMTGCANGRIVYGRKV